MDIVIRVSEYQTFAEFKSALDYAERKCADKGLQMVKVSEDEYRSKQIPEPSEKESLIAEKNRLKKNLKDTDYIDNKLIEAIATGGEIKPLVTEYAEVLYQRKQARARINEIETIMEV